MSKNKPVGYFDFVLAIDCETTGVCFSSDSAVHNEATGERHQTVSWGVLVVDATKLNIIEELYIEIAWNKISIAQRDADPTFGKEAESVHGLTKEYLDEHGITEEEAVVKILNLVAKYWGAETSIVTLGHNVHTFDMVFLRDLVRRQGIELRLNNRHIDTNSIGFANWQTYNSDQLFDLMGFEQRTDHNALEDIKMTLAALRASRLIFQRALN